MNLLRIFLILGGLFPLLLWSQPSPELKLDTDLQIEKVIAGPPENFHMLAAGRDGAVLFYQTDSFTYRKQNALLKIRENFWRFTKYTTDFTEIWSREIPVRAGVNYLKHYKDGSQMYVLLLQEKKKNQRYYQIANINVESGALKVHRGRLRHNVQVNDFSVVKNQAYIGGETIMPKWEGIARGAAASLILPIYFGALKYNEKNVCARIDMDKGKERTLPYEFRGRSKVVSFARNPWGRSMTVVLARNPKKGKRQVYLHEYAGEKLIRELELNPKGDNRLLTAKIKHLNRYEFMVVGTYAGAYRKQKIWKRIGAMLTGTRLPDAAQGIYVARFQRRKQVFIRYYNFTEFENFFEAYGPKEEKKVKSKVKKNKKRNKRRKKRKREAKEIFVDANLHLHDIIEAEDQYLMVAEAYKEMYRTRDRNGQMIFSEEGSAKEFIGYQYTHGIIGGINKETGRMKWDNSFPIWNMVSKTLQDRIQVLPPNPEDSITTMVYNFDAMLQSRKIKEGEVVENRAVKSLGRQFIRQTRDVNSESAITHWFDNYFLAWGYKRDEEEINGRGSAVRLLSAVKETKKLFYIYRVAY